MSSLQGPPVRVASYVRGVGFAVPSKVVPNTYFESYLDTNDEWIRDRTGISERRWVEDDVAMSDLALPACRRAIESAGLTVDDIDAVIVGTVTPDNIFPSTACVLQSKLGVTKGFAFDLNAVCSGFLYALTTADAFIAAGRATNVLVVGADLFSRILDPNDRSTVVLFGDGAGAFVLSSSVSAEERQRGKYFVEGDGATLRGIYHAQLNADGTHAGLLQVPGAPGGGCSANEARHVTMNGREVFKLATRGISEACGQVLKDSGFRSEQVDYFVVHQANQRILAAVAKQLGIAEERVLMNVQRYGNTSAASLPILISEYVEQGVIKKGQLLLMAAFGGGLTWGAALIRF